MKDSVRGSSLAALLGALTAVVSTPFMASVWVYEPGVVWSKGTLVERTFGPLLESRGLLTFGGEGLPYEVYGKGFFLVYLLMVPITRTIHDVHLRTGRAGPLEKWTWRGMHSALLAAMIGDASSYWGKSLPGEVGDVLWGTGFGIEIFAIAVLLVASLLYGIVALRVSVLPRWASALLILALRGPLLVTSLVTDYWPNGLVLPLSLTWAAIGVWLWSNRRAACFSP